MQLPKVRPNRLAGGGVKKFGHIGVDLFHDRRNLKRSVLERAEYLSLA
jgi:hypothetical protein